MLIDNNIVVASWPRGRHVVNNWGDLLNRELIRKLSLRPVAHESDVTGWAPRPVYRVIGSGISGSRPHHIIWGMGFMDKNTIPKHIPFMVRAVRGPRSRNRLIDLGINCPDVYGDPSILYRLIYDPFIEPSYDYGIIQHFREAKTLPAPAAPPGSSYLEIDICSGIKSVIDKIKSCRTVISSSLHGIICAHAYGIPAHWLKASDLPLGDDFKFYDYYSSIGYNDVNPAIVRDDGSVDFRDNPSMPGTSLIRCTDLLESCPFIDSNRRRTLVRTYLGQKQSGAIGTIFM